MKTISAAMIVQNEEMNIPFSIYNPLIAYNEVFLVDGGSEDNTIKIAEQTAKKLGMEHKLKIHCKKFTTLNDQRNYYLKNIKSDRIHYIDADEIYTLEHLEKIKNIYMNYYDCIQIRSYHFYIDFYHIAVGGGWDQSWMMAKFFKNYKNRMHYAGYSPMRGDHDLYIDNTYFMEFFKKRRKTFPLEDIACYHISHALGREHQKKKMLWWLRYDHPEIPEEKHESLVNNDGYFDRRFWEEGVNADPNGIVKFTGKHPDILKLHPCYNTKIIKD